MDDMQTWLSLIFAGLMGLAILIYVCLDGYDLGVGILFARAKDDEKDRMIASIGPFWDANETWLVLSIGILLVAFPTAYGTILSTLYLPVAVMLIGLILRGVAFEFRAKVKAERKGTWNRLFFCGSLAVALAQGFMLGLYIMGLKFTAATVLFACLTAICLSIGYAFVGATWLVLKMEGDLQHRAIRWARGALGFVAIGFGAISAASPLVSPRIFDKWFTMPAMAYLAPLPIVALILLVWLWRKLGRLYAAPEQGAWRPFLGAVGVFVLAFAGLAYSFYPYIVPDQLTIYEKTTAPESLMFMLIGALIVLPFIIGYTVYAYWVFRGKATQLRYD
ncbi:MAG TPA: cytochrome d ubiquinol oxidase subunit II [Alphaproteobacteria bacterium]|nr:cytochrome d ubiquinol oxidase subunit II [Alphaproteobacteria bacterium]